MEISLFFEPVDCDKLGFFPQKNHNRLGDHVVAFSDSNDEDDLTGFDAIIVGVNEGRQAINNAACENAPDEIRKYLYKLYQGKKKLKIGDLGNIRKGETTDDTHFALKSTIARLLASNVVAIIIGGGQELTYSVYLGFEDCGRVINLMSIDARFDYDQNPDAEINSQSFLSKIVYRKPSYLFNYSNLCYQTYFVDQSEISLLDNLYFDTLRLGEVRENIEETEPIIRNADFVSFDISAVKQSEAPGNGNASPNGLYGEEACQLIRYAGLSSRLSCIGFFETNPNLDPHGHTSHLVAQMIWYFLDGRANRVLEYPGNNEDGFIKYIVNASGHDNDLIFYKSKTTDRWWMELPVSLEKGKNLLRHIMVSCSYNDYLKACNNEIPDRWWKAYQKLM